jgi:hypothetical protein
VKQECGGRSSGVRDPPNGSRRESADPSAFLDMSLGCNIYVMRRTTVFLEEPLLKRARQYARREGISFAQVVREAIALYLARGSERAPATALPSFAGRFSRGDTDTSARVDELLWQEPHA